MRLRLFGFVVALSALSSALGQELPPTVPYATDRVLVKFDGGASFFTQSAAMGRIGAQVVDEVSGIGMKVVELPANVSVEQAIAYLRTQQGIAYVEPDYRCSISYRPNDTNYSSQYAPQKIQCEAAWDVTRGDPGIIIAIVDTGIDLNHTDLSGKIVPGYDFVNRTTSPQDDNGHGTHCAGIAAARTDNRLGIAGVGFNCRLMAVKVLDRNGSGFFSNVAAGIVYAVDNGAKVVSLSLGGSNGSQALQDAVNYAHGRNVLVVAAAGNSGSQSAAYPAFYTNALAVGSSTNTDARSNFSNYGSWVSVCAPGSNIYSTYTGNRYTILSGTSMATPAVAGLAGLLYSRMGSSATATQVRRRIEDTCDPVGNWVAKGRINAARAVTGVVGGVGVSTLTANPNSVYGPGAVTGAVTLSGPAPSGGLAVTLASSRTNVLTVPASITVPANATQATFAMNALAVTADTDVTVSATGGGVQRTVTVRVLRAIAPSLDRISLGQGAVTGPAAVSASAWLTAPAQSGGMIVALSSSNPSIVSLPISVLVPAGAQSVGFTVNCGMVTRDTDVVITGVSAGVVRTATIRIVAATAQLQNLSVDRSAVISGQAPYPVATVHLSAPAPPGGASIDLRPSSTLYVNTPARVIVPAGRTSATFTVTTYPVSSMRTASVTATYRNVSKLVTITLHRR